MIYKIGNLEKDIKNKKYKYIPKKPGIYRVLNLDNIKIEFLSYSSNSSFVSYPIIMLQEKYNKTKVNNLLYVGKGVNLHKRIKQYIEYGLNLVDNHKGGRAIFQIKDYKNLYIEVLLCDRCECVEKNMLIGYKEHYKELPVANMKI
ncbi:MAG: hypothetical protein E7373_03005 [Clostridiales bacterium]|nr:hypothetical protein [Clostridiales bacterium]